MITPETAADYIPLLKAFAKGLPIEYKGLDGMWRVATNLEFCEPPERYRVKREPREWLVACSLDGTMHVDLTGLAAPRGETLRVREILD